MDRSVTSTRWAVAEDVSPNVTALADHGTRLETQTEKDARIVARVAELAGALGKQASRYTV